MNKKKIAVVFIIVVFSLISILTSAGLGYMSRFFRSAGLRPIEAARQAWRGFRQPFGGEYLTILVLGIDQRPDDESLLTDTIMLATINAKNGDYLLFSLPRDLWIPSLQTKINALYYYGKKKDPDDGVNLIKSVVEEILDWKIDHVAIIGMDQLSEVVDQVGGININIEHSFVDKQFPAPQGDGVIEVSFNKGLQQLSGEKALKYMRSRKSLDPIEGTDEARQIRQKNVIFALKEKLVSDQRWALDPAKTGSLFNFLTTQITTKPALDLTTLSSYWRVGQLLLTKGKQKETELEWRGDGAILTPARDPIHQSWILLPVDSNWQAISSYFHQNLP